MNNVPAHLYSMHSWVPLSFSCRLSEDGDLSVSKYECNKNTEAQTFVYDLYGVVCFINDEKRNIVALIDTASPNATEKQWFIFNDFR